MRGNRVSGESDLIQVESVEERIEIRKRARGRDAVQVAGRTRATSALVDVDDLATVREHVEDGSQVGESESRPARDDHERRPLSDP